MTIAIVGKYTHLPDSYKSLAEALAHGGIANNVRVKLDWIDSEVFEAEADAVRQLEGVHGILVPGGFGERGAEGKIEAARFARERRVPYFGICFGMQMAVIEAARHLAGLPGAGSTEFGPCEDPVIGLMTEWMRGNDDGAARVRTAISAARCGSAPTTRCWRRGAGSPTIYGADADQRAPPPPLRGQHQLSRAARGGGPALFRHVARRRCCPRSSRFPTIPGSSACSSTPS